MKNSRTFVTRLAQGAAVSSLATCSLPHSQTDGVPTHVAAQEVTVAERTLPSEASGEETGSAVFLTIEHAPSAWDKGLEREFRKLALQEAKGTLSAEQMNRLEKLNQWRDQLLCPQSVEETLLQIRRNRLLVRTEELLNDYVEFQEGADKKRAAA